MLEYLEAAILGLIQGLTEFLPVSSSGHLEIAKYIFGENTIGDQSLLMTVVLHFATALSTIIVFRRDISVLINGVFNKNDKTSWRFVLWIIISMIPAAIIGVFFDEMIESMFSDNLLLVSMMLIVTALLLLFAEKFVGKANTLNPLNSFLIGIAQAVAIIPGISRSGATIASALLLGVEKVQAARFSFLMVVPLIFGKMAKDIFSGEILSSGIDKVELSIGFVFAFVSGIIACTWMIAIVKRSKLKYFAIYCALVGLIGCLYVFAN